MTKHYLTIMRHAEAKSLIGGGDIDRPLSKTGIQEAQSKHAIVTQYAPDMAFCSPAVRARQTLDNLNLTNVQVTEYPELYYGQIKEIFDFISSSNARSLLLVSHQPTVAIMAQDICTVEDQPRLRGFRTATVCVFEVDDLSNFVGNGRLVAFDH